jgi:hypothetical protein
MPAITSLGIGSGLDINSMVSQLVALEGRPLEQMKSQASQLQTQVSSFGKLSSLFSTLQSAANKLTSNSLWSQSVAASSDSTAVSIVGGSTAAAGNYAVSVQKLASPQTVASGTAFAAQRTRRARAVDDRTGRLAGRTADDLPAQAGRRAGPRGRPPRTPCRPCATRSTRPAPASPPPSSPTAAVPGCPCVRPARVPRTPSASRPTTRATATTPMRWACRALPSIRPTCRPPTRRTPRLRWCSSSRPSTPKPPSTASRSARPATT